MTREEAKKVFEYLEERANTQESCDDAISRILKKMWNCRGKHTTSIDKVAMEQIIRDELSVTRKPIECDDAISREDAEQMFRNIRSHLKPQDYKSAEEFNTRDLMLLNAEQMIHALPSVMHKSGKWRIAHGWYEDRFWCSCGYIRIMDSRMNEWKYCPVCGGAKMVEPQESEDK